MQWDYIVVGAGSAGCALAHELASSDRCATVLLIEAGGADRSPFIKIPAGQLRAVASHDWGFRSQPDPSRNGRVDNWLRGRTLGGSSSINGTVYVRGAAEDFDRWADQYCDRTPGGWSAKEVVPIFGELEASDQPGPSRGKAGRLHIRTVKRPHPVTQAFMKSAVACGYPFNEDYNGDTQEGVSYVQLTQRGGVRCSAADAFLKPLRCKKNVRILLNASARKIEFVDRRAVAVSFSKNGRNQRATAHVIILCAGAINTPKILMLSGIGDPEELSRHNIDVVAAVSGMGRNLKEHPLLRLMYRTRIPTFNLTTGIRQKLGIISSFVRNAEGPLSNLFEGVAFLRTSSAQLLPDIQLHVMPIGYLSNPGGALDLAPYPAMTVLLNKSRPVSSGRIRLVSDDPDDPPSIECQLLEAEEDVETMVQGVRAVRRIMAEEPIAGLIDEEVVPGAAFDDAVELRKYVRGHTGIAFHPVGTCRMGSDTAAVVGPDLRVRGTDNLWIADASIMPDLISGNINAACMMIGKKLGKQLIERMSGRDAAH
jgi:choline dehydrogenase